jgi:hypothetical protein
MLGHDDQKRLKVLRRLIKRFKYLITSVTAIERSQNALEFFEWL